MGRAPPRPSPGVQCAPGPAPSATAANGRRRRGALSGAAGGGCSWRAGAARPGAEWGREVSECVSECGAGRGSAVGGRFLLNPRCRRACGSCEPPRSLRLSARRGLRRGKRPGRLSGSAAVPLPRGAAEAGRVGGSSSRAEPAEGGASSRAACRARSPGTAGRSAPLRGRGPKGAVPRAAAPTRGPAALWALRGRAPRCRRCFTPAAARGAGPGRDPRGALGSRSRERGVAVRPSVGSALLPGAEAEKLLFLLFNLWRPNSVSLESPLRQVVESSL